MARSFPIKEIALQAGIGAATVDRVLNGRTGVSPGMARRVQQAILELERQSAQVGIAGRKFLIDLVMETPDRFARVVRDALEREMPGLHPAVFRARYHLSEAMPVEVLVATLNRIATRGSHGVLLKAPDRPEIVAAISHLHRRHIPVVTLVTDIPRSDRLAYVGMDNRAAGETAAYLIGQWLPDQRAGVLVSLSSSQFQGEGEREIGFRQALRRHFPHLTVHEISEGYGMHEATLKLVRSQLAQWPDVMAVYSIGGANASILEAFAQMKRPCKVFIGHDLDSENIALLRRGLMNAVLHHDLNHDMRTACQHLMSAHKVGPREPELGLSNVQVITPFNIPEALATATRMGRQGG